MKNLLAISFFTHIIIISFIFITPVKSKDLITAYVLDNGVKSFFTLGITTSNSSIEADMNRAITECKKKNLNKTCLIDSVNVLGADRYYSRYKKKINNFNKQILSNSNTQSISKIKKEIKTTYKNTSLFDLSYDPLINIELLKLNRDRHEAIAHRVPDNMKKVYGKGCNAMKCMGEAAAREMSKRFKRNEDYNSRYPGNIFFAMAYFELFYEKKLDDNERFLKRVKSKYPNHSYSDGIKIYNLIKLNRVRSKLRNTLGMTLLTPNYEAVKTFWVMGEYLEKNKSSKKIEKNLSKDLKKRLDILEKYREVSRSIQKKIDEEKEEEMMKLLANKKKFLN